MCIDARFDNPVATHVERRGISLASAFNLDEGDIDYVCRNLLEIVGANAKPISLARSA